MKLLVPGSLVALSLLLVAAIGYESLAPLNPIVVEHARLPARAKPASLPQAYAAPPEAIFSDIDSRPLFSAARRPLADPVQSSAAAASSDLSLTGVITGGDRAIALIRSRSSNTTSSAALGESVNGWRVVKIDATTVTLRANGSDTVLDLETPGGQAPSAALTPLPSPGAPAAPPSFTSSAPPKPAAIPALVPSTSSPVSSAPAATAAAPVPSKPSAHPNISPDALRGATTNPATGEITL